jgi:hypothetical protein
MTEAETAWLAGLLEGEGSFFMKRQTRRWKPHTPAHTYSTPKIKVGSTDLDVIQRVAELWGTRLEFHRRRQDHWKDQWVVCKAGAPAVEIMRQVLPWMGERRSAKIQEVIAEWEGSRAA